MEDCSKRVRSKFGAWVTLDFPPGDLESALRWKREAPGFQDRDPRRGSIFLAQPRFAIGSAIFEMKSAITVTALASRMMLGASAVNKLDTEERDSLHQDDCAPIAQGRGWRSGARDRNRTGTLPLG